MNTPDISVVISTHNDADYLEETISSVCAQDASWELIVVNDGCPDPRTVGMLDRLDAANPNIRIIHKNNEGLTRALIDGCLVARGKYIARMDVGDGMADGRLSAQCAVLDQHDDVVLVTGHTEMCDPEWEVLSTTESRPPQGAELFDQYWIADVNPETRGSNLLVGPTSHPSVMFRRDAYLKAGGYRSEFRSGQDWDLWYSLALQGKFAGLNKTMCRCRLFPDSVSSGRLRRQQQVGVCSLEAYWLRREGQDDSQVLERVMHIHDAGFHLSPRIKRARGNYFIGMMCRDAGLQAKSQTYLQRAWRLCPWNVKYAWRALNRLGARHETS